MAEPHLSVPLSDARSASVGKDNSAELPHRVSQAVPLDSRADLLRAGSDVEVTPGLQTCKMHQQPR